MIQIKKTILTLVALLAVTTGAWATDETLLTTITPTGDGTYSETTAGAVTVTPAGSCFYSGSSYGWRWDYYGSLTVTANEGYTITRCVFIQQGKNQSVTISKAPFALNFEEWLCLENYSMDGVSSIEVYGTAPAAITVEPVEGKTNEWTFSMPGSDVVLTPQYAPAAQLDENGAPAAVTGLEIAADAAIITEGQSAQGTLLYAVTTSETEKPALTAFSATLPNAKDQTAAGTYYVWYYIQGHDTPQGQEPTAENTFNDSEIMGPVMVELLTNEHTLNIKQSPNITVTVAGTAKTPTDDKVTPVTTGQEVKIKAKEGYKFRKVEVKKAEAKLPKYADVVTICEKNGDGKYLISSFFDGTNANITTITKEEAIALAEYLGGGNIRVVYEEYEFSGDRYVSATNAAGNEIGIPLSTTNKSSVPLYYVPASN